MKRLGIIVGVLVVSLAASVGAHDTFLKFDSYFLSPDSLVTVNLLTGTFQQSENPIARERMRDVSLITGQGKRIHLPLTAWRDEDNMSRLELRTAAPGTYVVGVALYPKEIHLKAEEFNEYLEHDGIPDMLVERQKQNRLGEDAHELYSKHAKAIFQVGERRTKSFKQPLGYAVEIIPQQNPYTARVGQTMSFLCTKDGKPIPRQFVIAGWETPDGQTGSLSGRTDEQGLVRFPLKIAGRWYVKFIHMVSLTGQPINYESKWATLTFEIR
ncbi:MAG: DUF4198 domain-containing protein [Blastocatellia bacterium]|nr:DUF4198 domain-containing protein [Blastocatellia bacterium]